MSNNLVSDYSRPQTLEQYFRELAKMEGWIYEPSFVGTWPPCEEEVIKTDFQAAFEAGRISQTRLNVGRMPPEAIGNAVCSFVSVSLNQTLDEFAIEACPGAGHPDCKLIHLETNRQFALEIKATGKTKSTDSRMVLTSSSRKLRELFTPPVLHLILTAEYHQERDTVWIRRLALNFLHPDTPVNVRFEAAVTTRLLRTRHNTAWIGGIDAGAGRELAATCELK